MTANVSFYLIAILALRVKSHSSRERNVLILDHHVGSTTTEFKVRFRNHKSSMQTNKKTREVTIHFNKTPHTLFLTLLFNAQTKSVLAQIMTQTDY